MAGKKAPGCPHPKGPGEGQLPGEFHGLCGSCVIAVADRLREQGIHVAFTQHGASSLQRPAGWPRGGTARGRAPGRQPAPARSTCSASPPGRRSGRGTPDESWPPG